MHQQSVKFKNMTQKSQAYKKISLLEYYYPYELFNPL